MNLCFGALAVCAFPWVCESPVRKWLSVLLCEVRCPSLWCVIGFNVCPNSASTLCSVRVCLCFSCCALRAGAVLHTGAVKSLL